MMRNLFSGCLLAGALIFSTGATAVNVAPRGVGQALIFPYYNINGDYGSHITLVNQSHQAKAIRLRVAAGSNGASALSLNLYLDAVDVWTGVLFVDPATGKAALTTTDRSCTFPEIVRSTSLPQLADGRRYLSLNVSPDQLGGSASTHEGYIEAIEMGMIKEGTPSRSHVGHSSGEPLSCSALVGSWTSTWLTDPKHDLGNPTGGLSGNVTVVNASAGTIFSLPAVAVEDFRVDPADQPRGTTASVVLHTAPTQADHPGLDDAMSDPAANVAVAQTMADGKSVIATYPASTRAVDAVTAALMATRLSGDFDADPAAGAVTSFVLAYPTRRYYADARFASAAPLAPFGHLFPTEIAPIMREEVDYDLYDRDSAGTTTIEGAQGCGGLCPPWTSAAETGTAIEVLASGPQGVSVPETGLRGFLSMNPFRHGFVSLAFDENATPFTRPSNEGYVFSGRPVIGFRVTSHATAPWPNRAPQTFTTAIPMTSSLHCKKVPANTSCSP